MIAYTALEPWGAPAEDFRAGQVCATVANVHRDPRARPEAWTAADFMPALAGPPQPPGAPVLLADPEAQSALIRQAVFGLGAP